MVVPHLTRSLPVMLLVTALLAGCASPDQEITPASVPTPETTTPPVASKAPVVTTPAPQPSPETTTPAPTTPPPPKPDPLTVTAAAPASAATGAPVPVVAEAEGGEGTASCVWSGGAFADPASCETTVTFLEAGEHELLVTVTAGEETVEETVTVEAGLFVPSDDLHAAQVSVRVGPVFAYVTDLVNIAVLSDAGQETMPQTVPSGQTIGIDVRGVDPSADAAVSTDTPVVLYILDANGTVHAGPLATEGSADSDICDECIQFIGAWEAPADFPEGDYLIGAFADVEDGRWFMDDLRHDGFTRIKVVAPPA